MTDIVSSNPSARRYLTLDEAWSPPEVSVAQRNIARRSRASGRSLVVSNAPSPRVIQCESLLERKTAISLLTNPKVDRILEQQGVEYVDENGEFLTHVFDFLAFMKDGRKIGIAVRPEKFTKSLRPVIETIARQGLGFADAYCIVTEKHFPRDTIHNMDLIRSVRRDEDQSADGVLRAIIASLHGAATIESLVKASGLKAKGFRAVVRLIDSGELTIEPRVRIDYPAFVRPGLRRAAA